MMKNKKLILSVITGLSIFAGTANASPAPINGNSVCKNALGDIGCSILSGAIQVENSVRDFVVNLASPKVSRQEQERALACKTEIQDAIHNVITARKEYTQRANELIQPEIDSLLKLKFNKQPKFDMLPKEYLAHTAYEGGLNNNYDTTMSAFRNPFAGKSGEDTQILVHLERERSEYVKEILPTLLSKAEKGDEQLKLLDKKISKLKAQHQHLQKRDAQKLSCISENTESKTVSSNLTKNLEEGAMTTQSKQLTAQSKSAK